MRIKVSNANVPNWKEVNVKLNIPETLMPLEEIAHNMWWSWNQEATKLFKDLDPDLWKEVEQNPVQLLERLSYEKLEFLSKDKATLARIDKVYSDFRNYMDVKPDSKRPSVAYFCMEYGLSHVLKIYSGGLGILAGDYLKEASDSNVDMCAVGFLYRYGYFRQSLSMDGHQIANYEAQDFGNLPVEHELDENGCPLVVDVPWPVLDGLIGRPNILNPNQTILLPLAVILNFEPKISEALRHISIRWRKISKYSSMEQILSSSCRFSVITRFSAFTFNFASVTA